MAVRAPKNDHDPVLGRTVRTVTRNSKRKIMPANPDKNLEFHLCRHWIWALWIWKRKEIRFEVPLSLDAENKKP